MSAGVALQAVVTGLATGAVYGLVALGFTLIFRLTRVVNLAHGDLVVGTVFVGVLAAVGTTPVVTRPGIGTAVFEVLVVLAAGVLLSVITYLAAVRPYATAQGGGLGPLVATLAAGLLVRESLGLPFDREAYALADPLLLPTGSVGLPGGGRVEVRLFFVLALALFAAIAVERYVVRTRFGTAMRAVAEDRETASLLGVPARRIELVAFALAGLLAGLAGLLAAPGRTLAVGSGVVLGLKGVTAALLGGLGSLRGAIAGGLVLGVVESLATTSDLLGPAYADVLALSVLVVVLAARPLGLFARFTPAVE